MLQPIVKTQPAYLKDTFDLKKELAKRDVGWLYSLFTCDDVSMYTDIDTTECIACLSAFLLSEETQAQFPHYPANALVEAIKLVMTNNIMKFGDIIVKMIKGIATGMSPAPTIANLYFAIHENANVLGRFESLDYYRRFIDDGLAIWIHNPDPTIDASNYKAFQDAINGGGLSWTFIKRDKQVHFMDLTIKIEGSKLSTNLYQNALALHLFSPPYSCHPLKCFNSLVTGMTLRIHCLCSHQKDIDHWLKKFFEHLLDREYNSKIIFPLLNNAILNVHAFLTTSDAYRLLTKVGKEEAIRNQVFYKLKFHPGDPHSALIQKIWRNCVLQLPGKPHVSTSKHGHVPVVSCPSPSLASLASSPSSLKSWRWSCGRGRWSWGRG